MSVLSVLFIDFQALVTHTHESYTRNGRKSRNVEAEAFDQGAGARPITLVAHDLLIDGTRLELHDTADLYATKVRSKPSSARAVDKTVEG